MEIAAEILQLDFESRMGDTPGSCVDLEGRAVETEFAESSGV